MSTALTSEQRAAILGELVSERERIVAQVSTLADEDAQLAAARVSQDERIKSQGDADLLGVERNIVARMSESMRSSVGELDEAIARLHDGTYGRCAGCGNDIPAARLIARPRATRCIPCVSRR